MTTLYEKTPFVGIVSLNGFSIQIGVKDTDDITDVETLRPGITISKTLMRVDHKGKRFLHQGDHVYVPEKGWYQLNELQLIKKVNGVRLYRGITMYRSDTSLMALPFLGGDRKMFGYTEHMMNAFCFREGEKEGQYRIWVLIRIGDSTGYEHANNALTSSPCLINTEEYGGEFIIHTFTIPNVFRPDFDLFLKSKFSRMSEGAKERIYDFHKIQDRHNRLRMQLERSKRLRENMEKEWDLEEPLSPQVELRDPLSIERETFYDRYIIDDGRKRKST